MHEPDRRPEPPRRASPGLERGDVEEREEPSVDDVDEESEELRPISARREHRAEHVREVHPREVEPLARRHDRREHDRRDESPEEPARRRSCLRLLELAARPTERGSGSSRRSRCSSESAALMSPTCVNACGKLPSASPVAGSISSAKRPTSFANRRSVSKLARASRALRRPSARYSTRPEAADPERALAGRVGRPVAIEEARRGAELARGCARHVARMRARARRPRTRTRPRSRSAASSSLATEARDIAPEARDSRRAPRRRAGSRPALAREPPDGRAADAPRACSSSEPSSAVQHSTREWVLWPRPERGSQIPSSGRASSGTPHRPSAQSIRCVSRSSARRAGRSAPRRRSTSP